MRLSSQLLFEKGMEKTMRIGELGQAVGVDIETIRYYEKIGLLSSATRSQNSYRIYTQDHLKQLSFIRHCRALDISLADIKSLLDFVSNPNQQCDGIDQLIDEQLTRVRARLYAMQVLEQQLSVLRTRCSSHHSASECGILQELVAAAHGEACACHFDVYS